MKIGDRVNTNDGKEDVIINKWTLDEMRLVAYQVGCNWYLDWQLTPIEPEKPKWKRFICNDLQPCSNFPTERCMACPCVWFPDSYAQRLQYAPGFEEPKLYICEKAGSCTVQRLEAITINGIEYVPKGAQVRSSG
jgi:hypothetical protein